MKSSSAAAGAATVTASRSAEGSIMSPTSAGPPTSAAASVFGTVESVVKCSGTGTVIAGVIGALRNVLQQVTVTSSVTSSSAATSGLTVSAAVVLDETTEDSEGTNDVECTGESQMTRAEMERARGVRADCGRTAASSPSVLALSTGTSGMLAGVTIELPESGQRQTGGAGVGAGQEGSCGSGRPSCEFADDGPA